MLKHHKKNLLTFITLSLVIILVDIALVNSALYSENGQLLTLGITLDFVVVLPLFLYFILYRKMNKKIIGILPIALLGYIALMFLIPDTGQGALDVVKYILIPLEWLLYSHMKYLCITTLFFRGGKNHMYNQIRALSAIIKTLTG